MDTTAEAPVCGACGNLKRLLSKGGGKRRWRCASCKGKRERERYREKHPEILAARYEKREAKKALVARWRAENPDKVREQRRRCDFNRRGRKYGLTADQCDAILAKGSCAICYDTDPAQWCLDHCHQSGDFRDLLCGRCNTGLGMFRDNTFLLLSAAHYVEAHSGSTTPP